jgi:hypothetical protein
MMLGFETILALRVCLGDVAVAKICDNHANAWGQSGFAEHPYNKGRKW